MAGAVEQLLSQIKYFNNPRELVADAVSYYLKNPKSMKENFPELAKMIRKGVNESGVAEHITFHSIAGLIGITGLMAALQSALDGEDEEKQGILSQITGRGALST